MGKKNTITWINKPLPAPLMKKMYDADSKASLGHNVSTSALWNYLFIIPITYYGKMRKIVTVEKNTLDSSYYLSSFLYESIYMYVPWSRLEFFFSNWQLPVSGNISFLFTCNI